MGGDRRSPLPEVNMGRIKNLEEIKAEVRDHTGKRKIFRRAKQEDVESVLANLTSKDPEVWAAEWSRVAKPYEDAGIEHEQAGRFDEARAGLPPSLYLLCHRA